VKQKQVYKKEKEPKILISKNLYWTKEEQKKVDKYFIEKYSKFYQIPKNVIYAIYELEDSRWEDVSKTRRYGPLQIGRNEVLTVMIYFDKNRNPQNKGFLLNLLKKLKKDTSLYYKIRDEMKEFKKEHPEIGGKYGEGIIRLKDIIDKIITKSFITKGKKYAEKELLHYLDIYYLLGGAYIKWIEQYAPKEIKKDKKALELYVITAYHAGPSATKKLFKKLENDLSYFKNENKYEQFVNKLYWIVKDINGGTISKKYLKTAYEKIYND
jgi:hypothetical protein